MIGRVRGGKTNHWKSERWRGLTVAFRDWPHFRAWALEHGYGKGMQLDRIESDQGYGPGNCQWITAQAHRLKSAAAHKPDCACGLCRSGRGASLTEATEKIYDY